MAGHAPTSSTRRIRGALLVAPPDVERQDGDPRVIRFSPVRRQLPFPSLLVASRDDPWASFARSRRMAADWGAELVDVGALGHINAASGLGAWEAGQALSERLAAAEPVL